LKQENGIWKADEPLTPGITANVTWWSPDVLTSFNGTLWELDPVEVRPRTRPQRIKPHVDVPEAKVFAEAGVTVEELQAYLRQNNLALIISRNVTTRDSNDQLQPYNLRVPGGIQSIGSAGKIYDIAHFQMYQADLIRGIGMYGGKGTPRDGRRVLAQQMHDPRVSNPSNPTGPEASVKIAADGSIAAFVPARRALSWQTTDPAGTPVVRERYWLTFQAGEIRACPSCHGVNARDQAGHGIATNSPIALRELLDYWKGRNQTGTPKILSVEKAATGYKVNASSLPNRRTVLESTEDLLKWLAIGTNAPASGANFIFQD
jgi:hypothetical protein